MKYNLINATENDINILIKYKSANIFDYAERLSNEEFSKIKIYVNSYIPKQLNNYRMILFDNRIIGCILVEKKDDGVLLNEIYIEENYRNKGIGTKLIKDVILNNDIIYLWVYKENVNAILLYKKLGFNTIEETVTRLYMINRKGDNENGK
ncbi:MAG: GNAT family N-acetyltransferase [Bacilli bacterium]|nr:GNAT family N-acetyltransferase [Bacilli bacterium]